MARRYLRTRRGTSTPLMILTIFCSFTLLTIIQFQNSNDTVINITGLVTVQHEYARVTRICKMESPGLSNIPRDTFQPVKASYTYVYSAYLDMRIKNKHKIRIIAISSDIPETLHCTIYYMNGTVKSTPAEKVIAILDPSLHENFKYKPHLFYCNETWNKVVKAVSLTAEPCNPGGNLLHITPITVKNPSDVPDKMAVCLRTFHHVKSPYPVIEFIEMQKILGISHFYIYGLEDISENVQRVLDYYTNIGTLTVLPWNLPVKNSPVFEKPGEIAIHGQYSLVNDCLYRSMNFYRLVFMHDLDEYFIPRHPKVKTARQMLHVIQQEKVVSKSHQYAGFGFLNCYYCLTKQDYAEMGPQLLTIKRQKRHICLNQELEEAWWKDNEQQHVEGGRGAATKLVVYPTKVVLMGVHGVTVALQGYKREYIIPTDVATMHHYKKPLDLDCDTPDSTLPQKYSTELVKKVNHVCAETGLELYTKS